ncbi:transposase [Elysia marginata]|uniref:Transposase n=1 Tax=Elysia marginata TaxID=1093978 RepID=A0AAV4GPL4_9GAST|nr:transposase [Elysia marginata]
MEFFKENMRFYIFMRCKLGEPAKLIPETLQTVCGEGPHKARATTQSLRELGIQVLSNPAYSPDLAPCDFWLFPILKDRLARRNFHRIQDLAKAVNSELRTISEEDYQGSFRKWQITMKRCIESHGSILKDCESFMYVSLTV